MPGFGCLRAEGENRPSRPTHCVVEPSAFMGGQGAAARSIAYCDDGTTPTLKSAPSGGNTVPDVCYPTDNVKCLNPWDCQSKRQYSIDGAYRTLDAGNCAGGQAHGVCYALQGNGIDRADTAGCNGCGWREGEMYTLNTIDRPTVCFQQNQRDEVRNMGEHAGSLTAQPGAKNQNYLCYPETARSLCARHDRGPCVDRGQNVVAYTCPRFAEYAEGVGTLRANGGDAGGGYGEHPR